MSGPRATVVPITVDSAPRAAAFLHERLNPDVSVSAWTALFAPPWQGGDGTHGFALMVGDTIVGVYATVPSTRVVRAEERPVRNLAALFVEEAHRASGLLLVRHALRDKDLILTDFSPSGNVVAMNERMGFRRLDTATRLVVNTPTLPRRHARVFSDDAVVSATLTGEDAAIHRDHRQASAVRHIVVREQGGGYAYLVIRPDRRRGLRLFASPLYVGGDRDVLRRHWRAVRSHILTRHRLPFTLAERRILGFADGIGRDLARPRPKMVRGPIDDSAVDYLYSELTLVSW